MEEDAPAPATDEITVLCADGVRIQIDLNLFPSEFLRRLAASDFADKKEVKIPYRADHFYETYKKYLPTVEEYLQIAPPPIVEQLPAVAQPQSAVSVNEDLIITNYQIHDGDFYYSYQPTIDSKKYQIYCYCGIWPYGNNHPDVINENQIDKTIVRISTRYYTSNLTLFDIDSHQKCFKYTLPPAEISAILAKKSYHKLQLSRMFIEYVLGVAECKIFIDANIQMRSFTTSAN